MIRKYYSDFPPLEVGDEIVTGTPGCARDSIVEILLTKQFDNHTFEGEVIASERGNLTHVRLDEEYLDAVISHEIETGKLYPSKVRLVAGTTTMEHINVHITNKLHYD